MAVVQLAAPVRVTHVTLDHAPGVWALDPARAAAEAPWRLRVRGMRHAHDADGPVLVAATNEVVYRNKGALPRNMWIHGH